MSQTSGQDVPGGAGPLRLRRVLGLWDLVFYGIVLIQPIAPVPLFGVAQKLSGGYFVTTILIAMLAMLITAFSYGRMAALYPSAGSAYTYVGRGLNPHLGFIVGWAMLLDYLLQPLITSVWVATTVHARYLPGVSYAFVAFLVIALITFLNLRGVKSSSRANMTLLALMSVVIAAFIFLAVRYLFHTQGWAGLFSVKPFYQPATFHFHRIWTATSFAALTYIGFDGVTTLSEDVENPKRNVLLATVLVCLFTGIFGGLEVYLGQQVWPNWHTFQNLESAFMDVCARVGGSLLFNLMGGVLIIAMLGSGLTGGLGAARLLFGMGRDGVLPPKVFGHLDRKASTPTFNILIVGVLAYLGAIALGYTGSAFEHAGEMLNFGAFLAFMGVNLSTFVEFSLRRKQAGPDKKAQFHWRRMLPDAVLPLLGFAFCGLIWWNLNIIAKTAGGIWLMLGIIYIAWKTRGFRVPPPRIDFSEN
jgi:putrescine importer